MLTSFRDFEGRRQSSSFDDPLAAAQDALQQSIKEQSEKPKYSYKYLDDGAA